MNYNVYGVCLYVLSPFFTASQLLYNQNISVCPYVRQFFLKLYFHLRITQLFFLTFLLLAVSLRVKSSFLLLLAPAGVYNRAGPSLTFT